MDHQGDLLADFLAFYGIDLDEDVIDARKFVRLAQRVAVYGGVMAARIEAARDEQSTTAAVRPAAQQQDQQHVELAAVRVSFPGLISVAKVSPQEEVE